MALPWLIGAAVVGLGAVIAKAVNDDSSSSSSSSTHDAEAERRRREAVSIEQLRLERERKRADAQAFFAEEGSRMGDSLAQALEGVAAVTPAQAAPFVARLGTGGYRLPPADPQRAHAVKGALAAAFPGGDGDLARIGDNLDFYTRVYDVRLQGQCLLVGQLAAIEALDGEIAAWKEIEQRLQSLKADAGGAA